MRVSKVLVNALRSSIKLARMSTILRFCLISSILLLTKEEIFKDEFSQYLDDIVIYKSTVGYVSGNKSNPLDNIYL